MSTIAQIVTAVVTPVQSSASIGKRQRARKPKDRPKPDVKIE
jgi:hypothetical protein